LRGKVLEGGWLARDLGTVELESVRVLAMARLENDEQELTRKERREAARAQRKALEQAEADSAVRRTRLAQLGIVVAIVIVAIVVILVATGGGGTKKAPKAGTGQANTISKEVSSLIGGIPQSGNTLGPTNAPITLQYFGDLECPVCREFTLGALPSVIQNWVRPGKLRIEYRSLKTATREPEVFELQQTAALAAGKQQKMWYFVELFYHEQQEEGTEYVNESFLENLAKQVPGLDIAKWNSDRKGNAFEEQLTSDEQASTNAGFTGTPSFLIGRTGGTLGKYGPASLTEAGGWNAEIEKLLKA
jgi:protein-disulfide isomerase